MTVLAPEQRYTPEDLLVMPDGDRYELVDGKLVEKRTGHESDWVAGELFYVLAQFNRAARQGWVFPRTSYQCFPDDPSRVRRPDVSFMRAGRLPGGRLQKGHSRVAPDLVVEVISPNNLYSEVLAKVDEYIGAGVRLVWVVDPETRSILVCRPGIESSRLHAENVLEGEDVLPGFHCSVAELFPPAE